MSQPSEEQVRAMFQVLRDTLEPLGHEWGPMYADPTRPEQMCSRCCLPDRSPWAKEPCRPLLGGSDD